MKKTFGILFCITLCIGSISYAQNTESEKFDADVALLYTKSTEATIKRIEEKLVSLDALFPKNDTQHRTYQESRKDIVDVLEDMKKATSGISKKIMLISKYEQELETHKGKIIEIKEKNEETKRAIKRVTQLLYQLHNELYNEGTLDEIKLFTKMNNITDAGNQEAYMEIVIKQLDKLMITLKEDKTKNKTLIRNMYETKNELERYITTYQNYIKNIEKKVSYLESYMDLIENNKEKINAKIAEITQTRKDIEQTIIKKAIDIEEGKGKRKEQYDKLKNLQNYGADDIYEISWPVLPIQDIKRYFNDQEYKQKYNIEHYGLHLNVPQGQVVHAAQDGVVTHVSNQDVGISRLTLAHRNGYTSSYLYLSKISVKEGQIVRKGAVIGHSGGEAGTQGAGFFSEGTNLTFMLTKGDRFVDPLALLDLSSIKNKKLIPDALTFKYKKDVERRPIDLTKLKTMPGETERERQQSFLNLYAKGAYKSLGMREQAGAGHAIDPAFVICIGFAESTLGNHLTTSNNIGNVGNPDDPSVRTNIDAGPLAGTTTIYDTLDNRYLGHYNRIDELSRYRQEDKKSTIYASSTFNRQNNVLKCLTRIKGYHVPEDYAFRTGIRKGFTQSFATTSTSQRGY